MATELHRAELEVVLRDQHHNIGYGHASVEMADVIGYLEEEGATLLDGGIDKDGAFAVYRIPLALTMTVEPGSWRNAVGVLAETMEPKPEG